MSGAIIYSDYKKKCQVNYIIFNWVVWNIFIKSLFQIDRSHHKNKMPLITASWKWNIKETSIIKF